MNKRVNDSLGGVPSFRLALDHQTMEQICFVLWFCPRNGFFSFLLFHFIRPVWTKSNMSFVLSVKWAFSLLLELRIRFSLVQDRSSV